MSFIISNWRWWVFAGKTLDCIATIELVLNCKKIDPSLTIACDENS